ncbi:MAG: ABC transporter ATP-binding protein [Gemmatimonadota bacterium]|nr:MAG: ABC transporter ATP-binding protein [Gemmatimonadota bacterium]
MSTAYLQLNNLTKKFGSQAAVDSLTLEVDQGAVLALLGPSGSGKTTTLRLLAGFERHDSGSIVVDGRDVSTMPPAQRRFGMVFQHYALFPHLTVGENIAFGLNEYSAEQRDQRVAAVLAMVDLEGFADREVTALSGGQQQRVAVARALAPEPKILLLDEPLSNLDPGLRERTRRELRQALAQANVTTVFVTHEQEEAFELGDQVALINHGALEQVGTARELYEHPATRFVATFVGRASVVRGDLISRDRVRVGDGIEWPAEVHGDAGPGVTVSVVTRPEALRFTDGVGLVGTVVERRYTGARAFFLVDASGETIEIEAPVTAARVGDQVSVTATATRVYPEGG